MSKRIAAFLAATVVLAACGDSAGPGDSMTRAEALVVANALTAESEATAQSAEPSTASAEIATASVPTTFTSNHTSNHPCPQGGTLQLVYSVDGSFDPQVNSWEITLDGTVKHLSCAYTHEGLTITVNGSPDVDFNAHASVYNGQPNAPATHGVDGAFKWSASDGREGTCNIEVNAVTDFAAKRKTVNGAVCGHTIQETTTWN